MKTKLTLACLLLSASLTAQVDNNPVAVSGNLRDGIWDLTVIPREFAYNDDHRICIRTDRDEVAIYNNNFERIRLLHVSPIFGEQVFITEERELLGTIAYEYGPSVPAGFIYIQLYDSENNPIESDGYIPEGWTSTDIIAYLQNSEGYNAVTIRTRDDGTILYLSDLPEDYFNYDTYGSQYPKSYYGVINNELYHFYTYYSERNTYSEEWTQTQASTDIWYHDGMSITNYDAFNANITNSILLTQTLFNEDESYEYISYTYSLPAEFSGSCWEENVYYDENGNAVRECIRRFKSKESVATGFEIKSENGTVLQSFSFTGGFTMGGTHDHLASVAQIGGHFYLIFTGEIGDDSAMLVYKINRASSGASVQQVSEPQKISGAYKILHNGHVYIKNSNKTYTIIGQEVK